LKTINCLKKCGFCCTFTIIKTADLKVKVEKMPIPNSFLIVTEMRPIGDPKYFDFHKVKVGKNTKHKDKKLIFMILTTEPILEKVVEGERWFRISNRCKYLKKDNRCRIHRKKPLACKTAGCPLGDERFEKW